jgi:hypothetical protein
VIADAPIAIAGRRAVVILTRVEVGMIVVTITICQRGPI